MADDYGISAAREAGYSDREILDEVASRLGVDIAPAREAKYSDSEILAHLAPDVAPKPRQSKAPEPEPAEEPRKSGMLKGIAKTVGQQVLKLPGGIVETAGSTAEVAALIDKANTRQQLEVFDRIDRGETVKPKPVRGMGYQQDQDLIWANQYASKTPEERAEMRRVAEGYLLAKPDALQRTGQQVRQTGEKMQQWAEKTVPLTAEEESRESVQVTKLLTMMVPYVAAAVTTGGTGLVGYGTLENLNRTYTEALKQGADPEKAAVAAVENGSMQGLLNVVPAAHAAQILQRLPGEVAKGRFVQLLADAALGSANMLTMTEISKLAENAVAEKTFDPTRPWDKGVGEHMAAPAIAGAILPVGAAAAGRVFRPREKAAAPPIEEAANQVMEAPNLDVAIETARQTLDQRAMAEEVAALREFGNEGDRKQADLLDLWGGLNHGEIQRDQRGNYFYQADGEVYPLKVWDGQPRTDTISPALAEAQRQAYGKLGIEVVYFDGAEKAPFDGAVDPNQPDRIFLSTNPSRNAAMVGAHEITHVLERTTLPDGTNLADLLHQQVKQGLTAEGRAQAVRLFDSTAPKRDAFPQGPEGDSLHADAVAAHYIRELAADIGAEAPKFQTFLPRVIDAVQTRYGADTAKDVLQRLMAGIRETMTRLREFFFRPEEGAEYGQPPTTSQHWVTNLEQIHDTLARMYAERYGSAAEKDNIRLIDQADRARRDGLGRAPANLGFAAEVPPPEAPAGFTQSLRDTATPIGPPPSAAYGEAVGKIATYRRWLSDLDQERRAAAANSPEAKSLQKQIDTILGRVNGVEERLTKTAAGRLEAARSALEAILNPVGDSPDMARVRTAIESEQRRMAGEVAVGTPSPGMLRATTPAPPRRRPAPKPAETRGQAVMPESEKTTGTSPEPIPKARPAESPPETIVETQQQVEQARENTNTAPTDGQKEAGNYLKGRVDFHGLPFVMENPKGSARSGVDADGKRWEAKLPADYGYLSRTKGADGDQVDAYIGPDPSSQRVWVIDQIDPKTGKFDEHKAMLGMRSVTEARTVYHRAFSDGTGPKRIGGITEMSLDQFKTWLESGDTKSPVDPKVAKASPEPVAEQQQGSEFDRAVQAERERLWAEEMSGRKRGLPHNERMVDDAAREAVMRREAQAELDWHMENGLPQDVVHEVARLYLRKDGQSPKEAMDEAVDRWITKEEATALRHFGDEDIARYDSLKMQGEGDPLLKEVFERLEEHYTQRPKELPGDDHIPFDQEPARPPEVARPETARPNAERPEGPEISAESRGRRETAAAKDELASPPPAQPPGAARMLEDAGEKIGGARKDLWAERGLRLSDLEGMSEGEAYQHVTKDAVWPKPDYAKMVEAGMSPEAAALVKIIRDRLSVRPGKDSPGGRRAYVAMMGFVREAYADVKTKADFRAARDRLFYDLAGWPRDRSSLSTAKEVRDVVFSVYKGRQEPFRISYADERKAQQMVEQGFPAKTEPWTRRYEVRQWGGDQFAVVSKGDRRTVDAQRFATREEAEAHARVTYEKAQGSGAEAPLPTRPHLDSVQRSGADIRGGKDVGSQNFVDDFGFRGVEFGNWVASDERAKVVNLAYDALHDLAGVLGVPPKALSLDGQLGLAFGARGSGRAAAHYEPGRLVINMTKLSGAGSLAHEWGHALDHYFGTLDTPENTRGAPKGASGWYDRTEQRTSYLKNLRPEMAEAFDSLMTAIFKREKPRAEAVRDTELRIERYQADIGRMKERMGASEDAAFKKAAQRYIEQTQLQLQAAGKRLADLRDEEKPYTGQKINSSYYDEANKLSGKSGEKGYWSRPTEMFARAFEAYIFDKIKAEGNSSQYLVQGVEPERYASGYKGNPYPAAERPAINAAFDHLFEVMDVREGKKGPALFSPRQRGIPREATAITTFRSADDIKKHADYREAKAGNVEAAARLVGDLVEQKQIEQARLHFGRDALFVPVTAEEAAGHNAIPGMLARLYAEATGGDVAPDIVQSNRAFHTGADAMQRLMVRPEFDGPVEAGRNYILVDDVSVLGGTLAELASHIREGGGNVVGVVTLANASRSGEYVPRRGHVALIERRFGDEVRDRFGVEPAALTADEAQYLVNFRDVDELRARRAKAEGERDRRLREKGLLPPEAEEGGVKFSPRLPGERPLLDTPEATPEELAARQRQVDKELAEANMRGRKVAPKPQESAEDTPLFGGDRQKTLFSPKAPETPEFKRWFGDSKVVDENGRPLRLYHGTNDSVQAFDFNHPNRKDTGWLGTGVYLTNSPRLASDYTALKAGRGEGANVMPLYARLENPYYATVEDKQRFMLISRRSPEAGREAADAWTRELQAQGHDGVILQYQHREAAGEPPIAEYVVFDPAGVKSASGNRGTFDSKNPDITFSPRITGANPNRQYTPEQLAAFERTGRAVEPRNIVDTIVEARKDLGKKLVREIFDPYVGLRERDPEGYLAARMANSSTGAVDMFNQWGTLRFKGNAFDVDQQTGGVVDIIRRLGPEAHDFLSWVAANRAERLAAEDRENLFTPDDIAAMKELNQGRLEAPYDLGNGRTTLSREAAYLDALQRYDVANKNVQDLAVEAGLLKRDVVDELWANPFYVPFFRVAEEGNSRSFVGPSSTAGLTGQTAGKRLKGGKDKLNADLWENAFGNWAHMIDAAIRNKAANRVLETAERDGIAKPLTEAEYDKLSKKEKADVVWTMKDGDKTYWRVDDPFTLKAISALDYLQTSTPLMGIGRAAKKMLQIGVAADPIFQVRNVIRDTTNAIAVSPIAKNIFRNLYDGTRQQDVKNGLMNVARAVAGREMKHGEIGRETASAIAGGATMRYAAGVDQSFAKADTYLDSDAKIEKFWRYFKRVGKASTEAMGFGENINRLALYKQLGEQNLPHELRAYEGRDLSDFTLIGASPIIRHLVELVPYMNAWMQGLYKVGRTAAQSDKSVTLAVGGKVATQVATRLAVVMAAMTALDLALGAIYEDDPDYKNRSEYDRNANFWFKVGDTEFRIPRGFEVAALSRMATIWLESLYDKDMTAARAWKNTLSILGTQMAFNPIPQAVKPVVDIATNTTRTGAPIETQGMERLRPEYRRGQDTTLVSRGLSDVMNQTFRAVGGQNARALSPVQLDYLVQAYSGWLGTSALQLADTVVRSFSSEPEKPAKDFLGSVTRGMVTNDRTSERGAGFYTNLLYQQGDAIKEAYATYQDLIKRGRGEEARDYVAENRDLLRKYPAYERTIRLEGQINAQIRAIADSTTLTPDQKKLQIQRLNAAKTRAAEQVFRAAQIE